MSNILERQFQDTAKRIRSAMKARVLGCHKNMTIIILPFPVAKGLSLVSTKRLLIHYAVICFAMHAT